MARHADRLCHPAITIAGLLFSFPAPPCDSRAADTKPLLGPVEELAILDDFVAESRPAWSLTAGTNVNYRVDVGRNIPGIASSVMQIDLSAKDPLNRTGGYNWFSMKRSLPVGAIAKEADGVRFVMGSQPAVQWWMSVGLRVGNDVYAHVLEPTSPSRALIEHVIPFDQFRSSGRPLSRRQAVLIDGIGLDTSVPKATLYIDRITTYRQRTYTSWLSFTSSHPQHNLYQPGDRIMATLTPGGTSPASATAFRYEVQDFYEEVVAKGQMKLNGAASFSLDLPPRPTATTNCGRSGWARRAMTWNRVRASWPRARSPREWLRSPCCPLRWSRT